ncbi:hypothetical protein LCL97_03220 [Seohaeicola saemankumensis]|nr:hypothetical protein [Seohaeicola saemankumensis]MCA0869826.1 hypothetical protein [Seohaeicola saemankumensis]
MFNLKAIAGGAIIAAVSAVGVSAQTFTKYGEAGGWNVFAADDKTCVIETRRDGLIVQMGVLANQNLGYIGAFTQEEDVVQGSTGNEFIIDIDGQLFYGEETVMKGNSQNYSGAYIKANNPNFIADVANLQTMKVIDSERIFTLDLTGTKAAMAMGRECIAAQN